MLNRRPTLILILALLFSALAFPVSAQTTQVEGVVRDASGAVIANATVNLRSDPYRATTETDHVGRFSFPHVPGTAGTVEVRAEGFTVARQSWKVEANQTAHLEITPLEIVHLEIVLLPLSANEQVTVFAARTQVRLSETPGSTVLLSTPDIAATPALRVDDVLRQVPGFSLYRRSDSRFAVASNQGVSLRGLGGTAASRALVLEDGLPLVDAFGGWVYWDRIPREALSTVEVFRGGASNLYGSDALGGVVQFVTRQPQAPAINLETSYGNERTPDLSFWTGTRAGPWDVSLASEMFRTDGFVVVPSFFEGSPVRGSVDTPANAEDATVNLNLGHKLGDQGRIFARGNFFTEFRHNGTPLETNDTRSGEGAFGLDQHFGSADSLTWRAYGLVQGYDEVFSAVAADRDSESLTDLQHVPEQVGGGGVQWTHLLGESQTLIAGMDLIEVIGASDDQFYSSGTHTHNTAAGGRQRNLGWFGEDILRLRQKWTIILAGRFDDWSNFNDSSICTPVSGTCKSPSTLFAARNATVFDPRLSVLRSLNSHVSLTASIYRAFRAPTLNACTGLDFV